VHAEREDAASRVTIRTGGVSGLTLALPAGEAAFDPTRVVTLAIDGQEVEGPRPGSDRSWTCRLVREGEAWRLARADEPRTGKRHRLQGPIDDAFMDAFAFVMPTGTGAGTAVDAWVEAERQRAVERWRKQFRGEPRVIRDTEVTDADIARMNLVLWGTPQTNAVLRRIADRLPLKWEAGEIRMGAGTYDAAVHVPLLVYPNPLNPERSVVLNSGFTYREYDDLNNARQVPKLPDWAIVDVRTPPDARYPGKVVAADFFDEAWGIREAGR
jgi:hypothetical protein